MQEKLTYKPPFTSIMTNPNSIEDPGSYGILKRVANRVTRSVLRNTKLDLFVRHELATFLQDLHIVWYVILMATYRFSNMKVPEEKMRLNFNQIVRIFYPRAMETSEMDDF